MATNVWLNLPILAATGVSSLDGMTGALTLVAGSGISIVDGLGTITISATAPSGTVTSVSVASANGLAGTVANPTTTPAITLSTTVTGVLKGNGTAISAAVAGTDYVIPSGSITGTASNITASSNSTLTTLTALSLPVSQLTGTLQVNQGGTSLATLTANNVILGNGTSAPLFVAPSTSGNVLTSNGTTWISSPPAASGVTTVGAIDTNANSNALFISGSTISTQSASATNPGMVNNTTQSFSGNKTFTGPLAITASSTTALTINSTGLVFDDVNTALGLGLQPATNTAIDIINSSGTSKAIQNTSYGTGSTIPFRGRFARGTSGSPAAAQNGDIMSVLSGRGYGTTQFAAASTGAINIVAAETFTDTSNQTYLQFMATPTASVTASEHARVTATGVTLGPQSSSTDAHSINGGMNVTTRSINSNITLDTTTTDYLVFVDTSGGAITVTLPTPTNGRILIIKDSTGSFGTNNCTIARHASEKIEGLAASKVLQTNWGSSTFTSNGTDWFMI